MNSLYITDREFDIAYMNYIMNYDDVFCEFFQIIYNLYIGIDVLIIASKDDWSENILESLLKLIQQRYGYDAVYIETDEDYMYARNYCFSDFAPGKPAWLDLIMFSSRFKTAFGSI